MKTTIALLIGGIAWMHAQPAAAQDPALIWGELVSPGDRVEGTFEFHEYPQSLIPSFPFRVRIHHSGGDVEDVVPMVLRETGMAFTFTRHSAERAEESSGVVEMLAGTIGSESIAIERTTTSEEAARSIHVFRGDGAAPAFRRIATGSDARR